MRARDLLEIDFPLVFAAVILSVFGILFIYSSGITSTGLLVSSEYKRQIIWAGGGLVIALASALIDYKRIVNISFYLYLGILALLVYTCVFGRLVKGARAWIGFGGFGIQPSEFAKIIVILFLSKYLGDTRRSAGIFSRFVVSCLIVFIPMGIIILQPDFGTSLVFIPILFVMTFVAGISARYIIFLGACIALTGFLIVLPLWQSYILRNSLPALAVLTDSRFILAAALGIGAAGAVAFFGFIRYGKRYFFWIVYTAGIVVLSLTASAAARKMLREYMLMRLIVFLDPGVDPLGAGWHIIQSMTAIGSGGLTGKGYLQGTQSHYRFLPEQSTDFIFSIFTEEWGFFGGFLVFALFLVISLRLIRTMRITLDHSGRYICAGLSAMYIFHFLVNVGMTMGIMPITGIPLHFMSYGGSSVLSAMIGIGLALSVHVRRYSR
ncbi:MAG: rod shape-determining protein RodA [Treponema sp.]|jgi:rod shape determining protein RodA|nr:rod shape-determining protein RodA [Treponema sp.]